LILPTHIGCRCAAADTPIRCNAAAANNIICHYDVVINTYDIAEVAGVAFLPRRQRFFYTLYANTIASSFILSDTYATLISPLLRLIFAVELPRYTLR